MKQYGIRIRLLGNNPLRLPHLLGEDWESFRWYASEEARDCAYTDIVKRIPYYREGDDPAQVASKVERD